ncbi:MAG TPA: NEW3 domain-containing protein [Candidatus Thermoplasmatota archaeon]|nr:NEW3 domain-containing protein [Candidatus Thermoplasmatota archaeon]
MRLAAASGFLLAVLLAVAPIASSQAPPSAQPAVSIEGSSEGGTASADDPATFRFTVRNDSQGIPGGEDQSKADVAVTVEGVPEGWTVSVTPSSFELAPGASQPVDVQVQVPPDAGTKSATMTVKAVLVSPLESLEPILGQVPGGGASQTATDSAPLTVEVSDSVTRQVLETLGPWVYVLLLLLVAAVLVAIGVTVASRRTMVRLSAETRELPVPPGGKVAFPFRVEGLARDPDAVLLQVSAVQEGWAAFLPVPELVLEPGQPQEVTLMVIAPRIANQGTRQGVLVTATSAKAPKGAANLEFIATVEGPEDLPVAPRRAK